MLHGRFCALVLALTSICTATAWSAVGRTVGQFNVSPTGSAQYQIPIWAPPGPRSMQPNLALLYDSQSSIGPLGIGWSLSGLSSITRCNKTYAQDTTPAAVTLATSDGYCINGIRLRVTSGSSTYGLAGSTYQTEVADFSNVTAVGTQGNGPASFTVQARNGLTYYYGYTDANGNGANSQVLADGTTASAWMLSKVVDRAGNNYVINYMAPTSTLKGTTVPVTILWTPTSASTYSYKMQFNYGNNAPQSSIYEYLDATVISNPELLTSVEIFYNGSVVKDYFLGYLPSPVTSRDKLISVQECADSAKSNCLTATSVSYTGTSTTVGLSSTSHSAVTSSGGELTARYDLNGDGYPDIVYAGASTLYVAWGGPSGFSAPVNTAVPLGTGGQPLIGRIVPGTLDGILVNQSGTWYYYAWNSTSNNFGSGTSTGILYDSSSAGYQLADVNGDGLTDLIDLNQVYNSFAKQYIVTVYVRPNTSTTTASFGASSTGFTTLTTVATGAQLLTPDMQYGQMRRYDFNGDGQDDLVLKTITGTSPNYVLNTYELLSNGTGFTGTNIASVADGSYAPVFFTNWNDDACTDFASKSSSTSQYTLYISACNGSPAQSYTLTGTPVLAMDWDGDGRTDLLVANGSTFSVYLSEANGMPTLTSTTFPYSSTCTYIWLDANADGMDDLGCQSSSAGDPITYYQHYAKPDLASSFEDGYGNAESATYVPITQNNYTEHFSGVPEATYPDQDYIGPLYVVSQADFTDPSSATGATYNQTFAYFAAWVNLQGRGFEGFGTVRTLDSRNGLYDYKYYERGFPYTGMLYEEILSTGSFFPKQSIGTPLALAGITLDGTPNNQRYFPRFSNVAITRRELNGPENGDLIDTTSTNYTYDNYGNATSTATTVTDNDSASPYVNDYWTTAVSNTSDVDTAHWCLGLYTETQVTYTAKIGSSVTSVTRTKTMPTPDTTNCRYNQVITEPGGLYTVTENLLYDSFGNVRSDSLTGANMPNSPPTRTTLSNWGATGQFLNTVTDPSGAVTTWAYTSSQALTFGVPDSVKDANNLTTSWTYDPFGRKTAETRPDLTSTTWALSTCTLHCGFSNSVYEVTQKALQTNGTTSIRTDIAAFDPIDRVTQSVGPTVAGANATVQRLYNSMGLLWQQSLPFLSGSPYQQTFSYDTLNRLSSVSRPISSMNSILQSTSYAYAGRKTTVMDPLANTTTTITDVNGRQRLTTDALGYSITTAYDAAGSVTGITDSVGNSLLKAVTVVYGIKPFVTAATDADRGAVTYTIDSLGERIGWVDANEQAHSQSSFMTYDALSRPLTRTEPDLFTKWTYAAYNSTNHDIGQLINECTGTGMACVSSAGYSESRTFDSLGRLSTRSITLGGEPGNDPGGVFLFTNGYDSSTGFLSNLTYPISTSGVGSPLKLQYGYQYGLLQSVTDISDTTATCGTTCVLWTANAQNAFGEVTQETLGNNVVTNRTYDLVTSWLSKATAGVGGGSTLLNQSYLEDHDGNITQRQDNNLSLTESFAYDADNRIKCAALSSLCTATTFAYDGGSAGPGNLTTQIGVGTYLYPNPGQPRPHAVTSITGTFLGVTNPPFSYDANGNMTARASSSANIIWSSYNYPTSITAIDSAGTEQVQFSYGPDRQRWEQIYTFSSSMEKTYYVGGLMEVVFNGGVATYRHYVRAGAEPVAVYSRSGSSNTMNYVIEDHQGSVSTIASNSGAPNVTDSFSAFGQLRNSTTWSGSPVSGSSELNGLSTYTRQGYTFQTWLGQSMGLNHMNGRVDDAILGRFLSPDPHIPDPSNAQSYNRYSYVLDNPLTWVDPSGFKECADDGEGNISCEVVGTGAGGGDQGGGGSPYTGGGTSPGGGGGGKPPRSPSPPQGLPTATVQCTICCGSSSGCWGITPSDTTLQNLLPALSPNLSACLQSILFCNPTSSPQSQMPAPTPPMTPCPSGGGNNSAQQNNIKSGAALGFSAFAITGAVVAINIVGFPEVEVVEFTAAGSLTAAGGYTLGATILAGEPLGTMAVGAVTGGGYGLVVGGGVGAAIPSAGCHGGP
jgi:RHS repeat-associated protein